MKRFKHLLVHLDLEGNHDAGTIRYASAVSRLSHSQRVEFVSTGPTESLFAGLLSNSPARTAAWLEQANTEAGRLVRCHFRGPAGCRTQLRVLDGVGFPDLLERLRRRKIDLVIIGKSETNGTFVEKLTRKAPCSVLVVPAGQSSTFRRILVTTDFSDHSARAMELAVAIAKARKLKKLDCFHCYQIPYGHHKAAIPREQLQAESEAWAQDRYREFLQRTGHRGLQVHFCCQESPVVAMGILRQARDRKCDLLVMGARGRDALAAALLGSTTAQVVRETKIPALVVKKKGAGRALLDLLLGSRT